MIHASRLFIVLAFCSTIALGSGSERNLEEVIKNVTEAAPSVIDWTFEQTARYPQIPGIFMASVLRMGKQAATQKPAAFVVWALFGSTIAAEGFKIMATNYLQSRKAQESGAQKLFNSAAYEGAKAKDAMIEIKDSLVEKAQLVAAEAIKLVDDENKK
jgi:hypothetical protein